MSSSTDFLSNVHSGETLFVLGNSYSLEQMELTPLLDRITIGVNRILRHPLCQDNLFPTYLLLVDAPVVVVEQERLLNYEGTVVAYRGIDGLLERSSVEHLGFDLSPKAEWDSMSGPMKLSCNTAIYAVQLARRMGASKIVLLGVDLTGYNRKHSHFFGDGKKEQCRLSSESLKKVLDNMGTFVVQCGCEGISVVNVSPIRGPMDTVMPHRPLREVL